MLLHISSSKDVISVQVVDEHENGDISLSKNKD